MPDFHRLTVDAYAAQHPGEPGRQAEQSVAVHLGRALPRARARGRTRTTSHRLFPTLTERERPFGWLEPPARWARDRADVLDASCHEEHGRAGQRLGARTCGAAWTPHHETIRAWLDVARA